MKTVLPREQAVEDIFSRILASPEASGRLRKVFYQYLDDEHMLVDEDPDHFLQVLFHAYQNWGCKCSSSGIVWKKYV
ncbi:MAG: DUF4866 family protein [Ruminococcus sp.]